MKHAQLYLLPLVVAATMAFPADRTACADDPTELYEKQVKPLLKSRCFACHGALKQEASLRLDAVSLMQQGGDSGPVVVVGDAAASLIIERVSASDDSLRMPPEGKPLTAEQIELLKMWIAQGAAAPAEDRPEEDPRDHWSFKKVVRPAIPDAAEAGAWHNPVDLFLAVEQQKRGLAPIAAAEKHVLLRRLYIDLTGLPPSREELHAFLADDRIDAYERVVDRLLDSPQYGERWGRHWMDVWRYSDWYGRRAVPDATNSYAQIWRWRDWIIRSLNEDKGYDRMIREMLAADEIAPEDDANVVATGFLVRNVYRWNYNMWMRDNVEHTGKAFLGLSFNCCHCHDHKYDPLKQEEYFKFRAFFEPLELQHGRVPGEPDPGVYPKYVYGSSHKPIQSGMVRIFDEKLEAETAFYTGGNEENVVKDHPPIEPGPPAFLSNDAFQIATVDLPPRAWYPGLKDFVQREELAQRQTAIGVATQELSAAETQFAQVQPGLEQAVVQAQSARDDALNAAGQSNVLVKAISGSQSLYLDATQGRRALLHPLDGLKQVDDETVFSYRMQVIEDGHSDIQLSLSLVKGLTGGWISFQKGAIKSYRPGSFDVIDIGHYDVAAGEKQFDVVCRLQPSQDQMFVTVTSVTDGKVFVDNAPAGINGWNKARHVEHGFLVDVRTGTRSVYDDITFAQATTEGAANAATPVAAVRFDFESPAYSSEQDIVGVDGWFEAPYTVAPATSVVSRQFTDSPALNAAELELRLAHRRFDAAKGLVDVAQAKAAAAEKEQASLEARLTADRYRYLHELPDADGTASTTQIDTAKLDDLMKHAGRSERETKLESARLALVTAAQALAAAEILPAADANRGTAITNAQTQLTSANASVAQAEQELAAESTAYAPLGPQYPAQSSGRRTALANWIASAENPLTPRVAVNHIWLRHFGRGIVATPAEFGRNGARPTHQELLDWLAAELIDNNWKMKPIHRLIVTSQAYRRKSYAGASDHPNLAIDRDNVYLWRFNPARMEAEAVRDSLLASAKQLDGTFGGKEVEQSEGLKNWRRSVYFSQHGEEKMMFLDLFDAPDANDCYRRSTSVRPQQALALTNSELVQKLGRLLARDLSKTLAADDEFVVAAFEQILTRSPSEAELTLSRVYLQKQKTVFEQAGAEALAQQVEGETIAASTDPQLRARESFVQALYNHTDFVTVR
ncbi:MAG: PSD1 and planctomycete cytochrome C domain-containing protein [Planctomycetaceae bacterium]